MPSSLDVPSLGFGYPFDGFSSLKTLGASFSSQRSWAFPFEAFLQPDDQERCFQRLFRSGVFLANHKACYRRFNGFIPSVSRTPKRPRRFSSGRGPCFLGLLVSQAFSRLKLASSVSLDSLPSDSLSENWLPFFRPGIPGCRTLADGHFP
jgi:hypothetical protein